MFKKVKKKNSNVLGPVQPLEEGPDPSFQTVSAVEPERVSFKTSLAIFLIVTKSLYIRLYDVDVLVDLDQEKLFSGTNARKYPDPIFRTSTRVCRSTYGEGSGRWSESDAFTAAGTCSRETFGRGVACTRSPRMFQRFFLIHPHVGSFSQFSGIFYKGVWQENLQTVALSHTAPQERFWKAAQVWRRSVEK